MIMKLQNKTREQRNMAANNAEIDYMYNQHSTEDSLLNVRN